MLKTTQELIDEATKDIRNHYFKEAIKELEEALKLTMHLIIPLVIDKNSRNTRD